MCNPSETSQGYHIEWVKTAFGSTKCCVKTEMGHMKRKRQVKEGVKLGEIINDGSMQDPGQMIAVFGSHAAALQDGSGDSFELDVVMQIRSRLRWRESLVSCVGPSGPGTGGPTHRQEITVFMCSQPGTIYAHSSPTENRKAHSGDGRNLAPLPDFVTAGQKMRGLVRAL